MVYFHIFVSAMKSLLALTCLAGLLAQASAQTAAPTTPTPVANITDAFEGMCNGGSGRAIREFDQNNNATVPTSLPFTYSHTHVAALRGITSRTSDDDQCAAIFVSYTCTW